MFSEQAEATFCFEKLQENLSGIKYQGSKVNIRCPICGDSSKSSSTKRGWYYPNTNSYYCWNSGCEASDVGMSGMHFISRLLNKPFNELRVEYLNWCKDTDINADSCGLYEELNENAVVDTSDVDEFEIPDEWIDDPELIDAIVSHRKLDIAPFRPLNWRFWYDTKSERLVIPWLTYGKITYYQLRAIDATQLPKYKFPFDTVKSIEGSAQVSQQYNYLYYCEGCLDRIFIRNCISIGGIKFSNYQEEEVSNRFSLLTPVFFPDNPWVDSSTAELIEKRAKLTPNAQVFMWPKSMTQKDVNEYVMDTGDIETFADMEFLERNTITYIKAHIQLKFNK